MGDTTIQLGNGTSCKTELYFVCLYQERCWSSTMPDFIGPCNHARANAHRAVACLICFYCCCSLLACSRTEHGCDYMVFYTDDSMAKVYGESKYTGGKDGHTANWPGTAGLSPLEIPASHFFFRWRTDGSVSIPQLFVFRIFSTSRCYGAEGWCSCKVLYVPGIGHSCLLTNRCVASCNRNRAG